MQFDSDLAFLSAAREFFDLDLSGAVGDTDCLSCSFLVVDSTGFSRCPSPLFRFFFSGREPSLSVLGLISDGEGDFVGDFSLT